MKSLSILITALSAFLWPIIVLVIVFLFHKPVKALLTRAQTGKLALKVGGAELSVEESVDQQGELVQSMLIRVARLEEERQAKHGGKVTQRHLRILWVDDRLHKSAFLRASLDGEGHAIDTASSTEEAMKKITQSRYDAIVSDMARPPDERAGLTLLKYVGESQRDVPVVIYCGGWAARNLRDKAIEAGAIKVTSSGIEVLSCLAGMAAEASDVESSESDSGLEDVQ